MICPECEVNELSEPYKGFPAVRCATCAVFWAQERFVRKVGTV